MKRYLTDICLCFAVLASGAAFSGCTAVVDPELGFEMVPENQKMVMRHLTFKGGKVLRFDAAASDDDHSVYEEITPSAPLFETRLYRTDSVLSTNLQYGFMGIERSDTFGIRRAGFAASLMFYNAVPDSVDGYGYLPIFDTMKLRLSIDAHGSDTLTPVRYTIYELTRPLLDGENAESSIINPTDTTAYVNSSFEGCYDPSKPLFTFTFPDGKKTGPSTSSLVLTPSDMSATGATWDFVRRLMLIPADRTGWDGYANENVALYNDMTQKKWCEVFHGVYIKPDESSMAEGSRGALYATDFEMSGLELVGRNRNPKDPSLIKDTVGMFFVFYDSSASAGNLSVTQVGHDFSQGTTSAPSLLADVNMEAYDAAGEPTPREERTLVDMGYVDGVAGPLTELYFTDAFIDQLLALYEDEQDGDAPYSLVAVNRCEISFYLEDADYDWSVTQGRAPEITPRLDASMGRLGMYYSFSSLRNIPDYDYATEQLNSSATIDYGGKLNRSRANYTMNITGYMQRLLNYVCWLKEQGRDVHSFDKADEKYVQREIYIGPEAVSPFTFRRTVFQASKGDAPIAVELTYTMIK